MTTRFVLEQRFTAPIDQVQAAFLDAHVLASISALPDVGMTLLEQTREGEKARQRIRYAFTGRLSAAARAVVDPARLTWVEEQVHDLSAHRADILIVPDHYGDRFSCSGTVALYEAWGAVRRVTEATMSVDLPLVGEKVERTIVAGLRDHAAAEARVVQDWLDRGLG